MAKKFITYAESGVGNTYGSKAEKTKIIKNAIESAKTEKNKYVIGEFGGFAGMFDLGRWIEDKNKRNYAEGLVKKYKLKTCNYEKRFPYIMAAEWLERKLNTKLITI